MNRIIFIVAILLLLSEQLFAGDSNTKRIYSGVVDVSGIRKLSDPNKADSLWSLILPFIPDSMNAWKQEKPTYGAVVLVWSRFDISVLNSDTSSNRKNENKKRVTQINSQLSGLSTALELLEKDLSTPGIMNKPEKLQNVLAQIQTLQNLAKFLNETKAGLNIQKTDIETSDIKEFVLYNDRKHWFSSVEPTDDLYNVNNLLFVVIGNNPKLADFTVNVVSKPSYLSSQINDLLHLARAMKVENAKLDSTETVEVLPFKLIEMNPNVLGSPTQIIANWNVKKDTMRIDNKERSIFGIRLAFSASNIVLKNFKVTDGQLTVSGDSASRKTWQSSLAVLAELHLPRAEDSFESVWDGGTWSGSLGEIVYKLTLNRIGLVGGCNLSLDPLSSWYYGVNYSVSRELGFVIGMQGTLEATDEKYTVGDITSLSGVEKYVSRKYSSPGIFAGISFSPSAITKTLGFEK